MLLKTSSKGHSFIYMEDSPMIMFENFFKSHQNNFANLYYPVIMSAKINDVAIIMEYFHYYELGYFNNHGLFDILTENFILIYLIIGACYGLSFKLFQFTY